jgi:hypothetical protein
MFDSATPMSDGRVRSVRSSVRGEQLVHLVTAGCSGMGAE